MINTNRERGEMMEQFAEMEHTRWANWQSYLHSKCTKNADGSLTIPVESVIHWERQISTPYSQLTEREKESDRNEVRPYLEVFAQALKDAREEAYQAGLRSNEDSKNNAYHERNMLVCALTRLFPAYLARHDEKDTEWENDWRWIVYIDLPTGQVSWHIHDSERNLFDHLEVKENKWDGHNTERKYQRLMALTALSEEIKK